MPHLKRIYGAIHNTVDKRMELKIREGCNFVAQIINGNCEEVASHNVLYPFLQECLWRYTLTHKIKKTYEYIAAFKVGF